jgi:hypothetical protein
MYNIVEYLNKIFKSIVLTFLHFIRDILIVIKKHCTPPYAPKTYRRYKTSYELYIKEEELKSYEHFKKYFKNAIFLDTKRIRKYAILSALKNDTEQKQLYLEFGVFNGQSINYLSKFLKTKMYGFDSFLGLREDWKGTNLEAGYFNKNGETPKVNSNVELIQGWVQDTLPKFITKDSKINFIHIDLDTYDSTKFVLETVKPYLNKKTIILFDELYNFSGWDEGEYKALKEVFNENDYEFLAFSIEGCQAVIQLK